METQPPQITTDGKGIAFTNRRGQAVHVHLDDDSKERIWRAFMQYVDLKEPGLPDIPPADITEDPPPVD